ncbi:MAG: transposase [Anaerolineaceae bacterium]
MDNRIYHRRSIRLPDWDYRQGAYSVTIVTKDRENLFGEIAGDMVNLSKVGKIIRNEWLRLEKRFFHIHLDKYIVMPNHVHGIIVFRGRGMAESIENIDKSVERHAPAKGIFGKPVPGNLATIIRSFKSSTTLRVNLMNGTPGMPVWQRNYYEHIIREERDWQAISDYIDSNPEKWAEDRENRSREY